MNTIKSIKVRASHAENIYDGIAMGYNVNVVLPNIDVLTAIYYDDYTYMSMAQFSELSTKTTQNPAPIRRQNNKGLMTGKITKVLRPIETVVPDSNIEDYIYSAYYYDYRERLSRTATIDQSLGFNIVDETWSNTDKSLTQRHRRTASNGASTLDVSLTYSYDAFDRVVDVSLIRNGQTKRLSHTQYNSIGKVSSTKLGTVTTVDYSYATHGALESISAPYFAQTLHYADGTTPSYSGNISAINWRGKDLVQRRYDFTYDDFNRLTAASYSESYRPSSSMIRVNNQATNPPCYSTSYSYDLNSNPVSITRHGVSDISSPSSGGLLSNIVYLDFGVIDNIQMSYNGNRLIRTEDTADDVIYKDATDFNDGASLNTEYTYDSNGNMTSDANRLVANIEYNSLNLPVEIDFDCGISVTNYYDAEGTLLQKYIHGCDTTHSAGLNPVPLNQKVNHYGDFVYQTERCCV